MGGVLSEKGSSPTVLGVVWPKTAKTIGKTANAIGKTANAIGLLPVGELPTRLSERARRRGGVGASSHAHGDGPCWVHCGTATTALVLLADACPAVIQGASMLKMCVEGRQYQTMP